MNKAAKWMAHEVEKRSARKIKIHMCIGGTHGKSNEILDLISKDVSNAGTIVQACFTSTLPLGAIW